jgi:hypothetical protein
VGGGGAKERKRVALQRGKRSFPRAKFKVQLSLAIHNIWPNSKDLKSAFFLSSRHLESKSQSHISRLINHFFLTFVPCILILSQFIIHQGMHK